MGYPLIRLLGRDCRFFFDFFQLCQDSDPVLYLGKAIFFLHRVGLMEASPLGRARIISLYPFFCRPLSGATGNTLLDPGQLPMRGKTAAIEKKGELDLDIEITNVIQ